MIQSIRAVAERPTRRWLLASATGLALSLAAALTGKAGDGPIVAVISGGNIDLTTFCDAIASANE